MFTLPPSTHDVQFKESMQSIIFPSPFPGPTHRRAPFLGTKTSRLVLWPLVGRCLSAMGRSVALDGVTISHHRIPEELGGGWNGPGAQSGGHPPAPLGAASRHPLTKLLAVVSSSN